MDDTCAVCAETLGWVAYGPCGHREVCSTCVARLRCICEDSRCCICKSKSSVIFVTKALGDFTRMINDFSVLPAGPTEGQVGSYWYHEDTQAYFDDLDQYKMIKAMCKLSCSICDKSNDQGKELSKRKGKFRNIEQLKGHLFHQHKLFMCSLCLEGRKIFICEQKLYTRAQLNQHIKAGDSEVDGSESERGGFNGHPLCEFCRNPFYGENELYLHMSTEHYTCHICQRRNPGQYEYYKNYDDLEIHFRQEHFLCEDESCLAKKFVVFTSESEMKRHNAKEHGGHMSRSKRNAALQIPTSFRYRRNNDQDRRGRGCDSRRDSSDDQLSLAIQASLETANANTFHDTASRTHLVSDDRETNEVDSILRSFESLARTGSETSASQYREAVGQNSYNMPLEVASFPPLPAPPSRSKKKSGNNSEKLGGNTIAARLRRKNIGTVKVLNSSNAWPAVSHQPTSSASSSSHSRLVSNAGPSSSTSSFASSSMSKPSMDENVQSSYASFAQARAASARCASSSGKLSSTIKVSHSSSAPNVVGKGPFDPSATDFPPVSASQANEQQNDTQPSMKVKDVHAANKSLVERIRAALEFDEDKYSAFKIISSEYRQHIIDTGEYLAYVHQFGLSHLILELARLCPDAHRQKELVEIYNNSLRSNGTCENRVTGDSTKLENQTSVKKGKEKCDSNGTSNSKDLSSDGIMDRLKMFQSNYRPSEEVEILSKDGYRSAKGKSKILALDEQTVLDSSGSWSTKESSKENDLEPKGGGSKKNSGTEVAEHKQQKKASKFLRVRLGNSSAANLDVSNANHGPTLTEEKTVENVDSSSDRLPLSSDGLPVRGVWKNGGGQRLVAMKMRSSRK